MMEMKEKVLQKDTAKIASFYLPVVFQEEDGLLLM